MRKPPKRFPRSLTRDIERDTLYFLGFQDTAHGIELICSLHQGFEKIIKEFSGRWVSLCGRDNYLIATWYFRVARLYSHLEIVRVEMAKNPLIDWHKVALSMATLKAQSAIIRDVLVSNNVKISD